ncbi:MAG: flagellar motor switch protein FliN [Polyangiaceae bacterium]
MPAVDSPQNLTAEAPLTKSDASLGLGAFHMLRDVEVEITVEIGRRRMRIADVLKLGAGQTLELSKSAGEPLDIYVNGRLLGHGEAVVLGDRYGIRITEIHAPVGDGENQ